MISRVVVKNLYSFKDETEFNLFPGKSRGLKEHKYGIGGIEVLKLSAIYGANGAGKSNLVRAISKIKNFVTSGTVPPTLNNQKFKLTSNAGKQPVELGIEFSNDDKLFFYTFTANEGKIIDEYLSEVIPKNNTEQLLFHRNVENNKTKIKFYVGFEKNESNKLLQELIEKDLLKPDQSLIHLLNSLSNDAFSEMKIAYEWFEKKLKILYTHSKPQTLTVKLDRDRILESFANDLICTFHTGIHALKVENEDIADFFGQNGPQGMEEVAAILADTKDDVYRLTNNFTGEVANVVKDGDNIVVKRLYFNHLSNEDTPVRFSFEEESEGTQRLIDYIPAFHDSINKDFTYVIDEIERSIHPVIIKELLTKFSLDSKTKGQLIFTTHESNLLDQDILRTDEIWFAEKDKGGATKLYSLSDFKEHNTIDIRKGYLNGRYGAIPFVGNLKDLNWDYAIEE